MHRNSNLCQATPYCFMINVMLSCNNIYSINSVTAIIITSCLLWSSVFLYLCFTCLGQKLDNWKYTTRAPRFTTKSSRIMVQLFYDQNQTLEPAAPKLIKYCQKKTCFLELCAWYDNHHHHHHHSWRWDDKLCARYNPRYSLGDPGRALR